MILLADFWPECKGLHNQHLLDKHKVPYAQLSGRMRPLIYDRDGNFYYIEESGAVLDSQKQPTPYRLGSGFGDLYKGDEYVGNIYLNGAVGKNEAGAVTTFGAPLKAPKRCYVFMLRSGVRGKTWSGPVDITNMVLHETDGTFLGVAPGAGITTQTVESLCPCMWTAKAPSPFTVLTMVTPGTA